jgi:hypothetical protein
VVEADKMVHVGVGYKSMADFEKISARDAANIPQIE